MSGYDMKRLLEKMSKFYWAESNSQLYPILKKLEEQQLVTSRIDPDSGARQRRIYSITDLGLETLCQWLKSPLEMPQYREEVLLKLALGNNIPIEDTLNHIKNYRQNILAQQQLLLTIDEHIRTDHTGRPDQPYLIMTYHYCRLVLDAKLQWCDETLIQLENM